VEESTVERSLGRSQVRPRLNATARLNDAALMALLASRPVESGVSASVDAASATSLSDADDSDQIDSLDLAFETLARGFA
jgi:hypothetical protein